MSITKFIHQKKNIPNTSIKYKSTLTLTRDSTAQHAEILSYEAILL